MRLDLFRKLIEECTNLGSLQRLGLAFDAAQDLHRVVAVQPIAERSQAHPGVPIPLFPPPDLFAVHEPAKDALQAEDAVEGQAERRQPFFEVLVYEIREALDHSFGQIDAQVIRDREHAGGALESNPEPPMPALPLGLPAGVIEGVLERRERRIAANVVHDALDIQLAGRNAGAVVVEGNRHGGDPPAEAALLQQGPDHVGAPARPPVDGRRRIGCQPQRLDVEHEGIAAPLQSIAPESAADRFHRIDAGLGREGPEDLLAGQDPLRGASRIPLRDPGQTLERFAGALAGKRRNDRERGLQPIGFLA